jgi:hypothetical protein
MKARTLQSKETRVRLEMQRVADPSETPSLKALVKVLELTRVCPPTTSSPRASAILAELMQAKLRTLRVMMEPQEQIQSMEMRVWKVAPWRAFLLG